MDYCIEKSRRKWPVLNSFRRIYTHSCLLLISSLKRDQIVYTTIMSCLYMCIILCILWLLLLSFEEILLGTFMKHLPVFFKVNRAAQMSNYWAGTCHCSTSSSHSPNCSHYYCCIYLVIQVLSRTSEPKQALTMAQVSTSSNPRFPGNM